jgi:hypothetical protein
MSQDRLAGEWGGSLFATAHSRVAMGNSVPRVKAEATHQTAGNDEDGLALVLEALSASAGHRAPGRGPMRSDGHGN